MYAFSLTFGRNYCFNKEDCYRRKGQIRGLTSSSVGFKRHTFLENDLSRDLYPTLCQCQINSAYKQANIAKENFKSTSVPEEIF